MAELDPKSAPLNAEGELVGSVFCMYCGELNPVGAMTCQSCGQYIADQGPDLSARLQRIRRYARNVQAQYKAPPPRLIEHHASTADDAEAHVSGRGDQDPDLSARLLRIHHYAGNVQARAEPLESGLPRSSVEVLDPIARQISPTPWDASPEFVSKTGWLIVFVIMMYPFILIAALLYIDAFARFSRSVTIR
jgi:ribosomal protein L40E